MVLGRVRVDDLLDRAAPERAEELLPRASEPRVDEEPVHEGGMGPVRDGAAEPGLEPDDLDLAIHPRPAARAHAAKLPPARAAASARAGHPLWMEAGARPGRPEPRARETPARP